ncbi:MAG: helicase-related protein [Candidatus Poribacteria bacterium]|nr:helicase-related protein [Candidatus Poribacteria bacterium]
MSSVAQQTDVIHIRDLHPGVLLIDTYQNKERVIRRVESHDTFVQLFFENDDQPLTCSIEQLQSRFEFVSDAFRADANLVRLVAEAHRLQHAYLFNPIFATETSLIDPLPHQFIAVYEHLLKHVPLRFLLADDAGAGKTIMTGLYIQEALLRRQVERVLIVPPAGLIGNWERELRVCFRLQFRILSSADAADTNPFSAPENRLAIISLDTLRQDRMQHCLFEAQPYDLVVFDEAHKLSARYESDGTVDKSKRYELAERIANQQKNLLLLTATPHMGKDDAYYFLWRLLLPEHLAAQNAFTRLTDKEKSKHLLRRMKEEMITFDEKPIYPPRRSQTIAYPLKQGEISEQSLYDAVTAYCEKYFDLAGQYNRSAAKMAMMILQRRLASSTFALLQSLIRRVEKLQTTLHHLQDGGLSAEQLENEQARLKDVDIREEKTGDEEEIVDGKEEAEQVDEDLELATAARSIVELETEIAHVQNLSELVRKVYNLKSESKFENLWEALTEYPDKKVLIFTEHRDTMNFIIERLEALGFTGKVAQIHGGMRYSEREEQVEFFRDPNGAQYLVATDAAGEGINLQFCWLMVNYDIPWNPARLEQRMGRIHRYKQTHTVVLLNLIAEDTREGRVLKVLLEKMQNMREELDDDKVFDVIGQQFSQVSLKELITKAIVENQTDASIQTINTQFTSENIQKQFEGQQRSVVSSEVKRLLGNVQNQKESAEALRMLPAYVRSFFEDAAPLLGYRINGDIEAIFKLSRCPTSVQNAIDGYPSQLRDRLTFSRELALPAGSEKPEAIFLHPGEPIFDAIRSCFLEKFNAEGERGAIYFDPQADEPYLFYLARIPMIRQTDDRPQVLDEMLVGIKRFADGRCEETPAHLLLTLMPRAEQHSIPATLSAEWINRADEMQPIENFVCENIGNPKLSHIRDALHLELENKKRQIQVSSNLRKAELLEQRRDLREAVAKSVPAAQTKLNNCENELNALPTKREQAVASLTEEIENTQLGPVVVYVRAFVTESPTEEFPTKTLRDAEAIAIKTAIEHERKRGAEVKDVSNPSLKKGFDLQSRHSNGEVRYIEVKGRTGIAGVELTANEWRQAMNHRDRYWLYVVYHCDTEPQLHRCQDPFETLTEKATGSIRINAGDIMRNSDIEAFNSNVNPTIRG